MKKTFLQQLLQLISHIHWKCKQFTMRLVVCYHSQLPNISVPSVSIEISSHCNRRCTYCPVSTNPKPQIFMTREVFEHIIKQLVQINFKNRLSFHFFNEPLMNPELEQLIAYAHSKLPNAKLVIYTNGDYLSLELYRKLSTAGVSHFIISNHGTRENHRQLVSFSRENKYHGAKITVRTVNNNSALFNRGNAVKIVNQRRLSYCVYPSYECIINIEGKVLLCCNDYFGQNILGDILKESLKTIWTSDAINQIRSELLIGKFSIPLCQSCTSKSI